MGWGKLATTKSVIIKEKIVDVESALLTEIWGWGESNPPHHDLQSCALPLSYIP